MSVTGPEIESAVFRAPGPVIADRLDAMGIDAARVQADLDRTLKGAAEPATEADLAEYGPDRPNGCMRVARSLRAEGVGQTARPAAAADDLRFQASLLCHPRPLLRDDCAGLISHAGLPGEAHRHRSRNPADLNAGRHPGMPGCGIDPHGAGTDPCRLGAPDEQSSVAVHARTDRPVSGARYLTMASARPVIYFAGRHKERTARPSVSQKGIRKTSGVARRPNPAVYMRITARPRRTWGPGGRSRRGTPGGISVDSVFALDRADVTGRRSWPIQNSGSRRSQIR